MFLVVADKMSYSAKVWHCMAQKLATPESFPFQHFALLSSSQKTKQFAFFKMCLKRQNNVKVVIVGCKGSLQHEFLEKLEILS